MFGDRDLANRHRPATWEAIKGQTHTVEILRNQVLKKKGMSNVYLFHGPSGAGKTTIANIFFKAANCTQITSTGDACGKCKACENFGWDFMEVNCADRRGIDDARIFIQHTHFMPKGGSNMGVILDECHMLTKSAFSLLLKPLEELHDGSFWGFVTTEIDDIPDTILSRCQVINLEAVSIPQIVERLQEISETEVINISDIDLLELAKRSNGNLRGAIRLLEQYSSVGNLDWLRDEVAKS